MSVTASVVVVCLFAIISEAAWGIERWMVPCCHRLSGACFKPLRFTQSCQKLSNKAKSLQCHEGRRDYFVISKRLLFNLLRYQNINGTMLSQIVWVMFLAHYCLQKVAKNCQEKAKSSFSRKLLHGTAQTIHVWIKWTQLA